MNTQTFINLLKTHPSDEEVRFYCPINKTYYYVFSVSSDKILLNPYSYNGTITYKELIRYLQSSPHIQKEIKFYNYNNDQEFKIP